MDFSDGNIPSVYTEGITVKKKIIKKNNDMLFLPTKYSQFVKSVGKIIGKL